MTLYILTSSAQQDLEDIRDYLAGAPLLIRNRVIDELLATFHQAAQYPEAGRVEPQLTRKAGATRSLLRYPYRVFYYPETLPLQILAIVHGKRDPLTVLRVPSS